MNLKKGIYKFTLALAGACMLASCAQPTGPSGSTDPKPTPQPEKTTDELKVESAKNALSISTIITKDVNNIELPTEKDGVKIEWKSDKTDVITVGTETAEKKFVTCTVNHPTGKENATVKLTATLSLNDKTDTKDFNVLVYAKSAELTADDILVAAEEQLKSTSLPFNATTIQVTITLPSTLTVDNKEVIVSNYKDLSNNDNVTLANNKLTLTQDLVDYTAKLEATLTYSGKTKTVTIEKLIPRITVYEVYNNPDSSHVITFNTSVMEDLSKDKEYGNNGTRYSYKLDATQKNITLKTTELIGEYFGSKDKWISIAEVKSNVLKEMNLEIEKYNAKIDALAALEKTPTLDALYVYIEKGEGITDASRKDQIMANIIGPKLNPAIEGTTNNNNNHETPFEGKTFTDQQITTIKGTKTEVLNPIIKSFVADYKQNEQNKETDTWEDIKNNYASEIKAYPESMLEKLNSSISAKYSVTENRLSIVSNYDNTKKWSEQTGFFKNDNVDLYGEGTGYYLYDRVNHKEYDITFTDAEYTKFTYTYNESGEEKTGNGTLEVNEKGNDTTVTLTFDANNKCTLKFSPEDLIDSRM